VHPQEDDPAGRAEVEAGRNREDEEDVISRLRMRVNDDGLSGWE
jgi:hypothetical protein